MKPEAPAPALDTLTETGGSILVVGEVVELVKIGEGCETPNETGRHGVLEIGVEVVAVGEGTETVSMKSIEIGKEIGILIVTS